MKGRAERSHPALPGRWARWRRGVRTPWSQWRGPRRTCTEFPVLYRRRECSRSARSRVSLAQPAAGTINLTRWAGALLAAALLSGCGASSSARGQGNAAAAACACKACAAATGRPARTSASHCVRARPQEFAKVRRATGTKAHRSRCAARSRRGRAAHGRPRGRSRGRPRPRRSPAARRPRGRPWGLLPGEADVCRLDGSGGPARRGLGAPVHVRVRDHLLGRRRAPGGQVLGRVCV